MCVCRFFSKRLTKEGFFLLLSILAYVICLGLGACYFQLVFSIEFLTDNLRIGRLNIKLRDDVTGPNSR